MSSSYAPIKESGQKDALITVNEDDAESQQPKEKITGIKGAWKWFIAKPWERWPFALFILFALASLIWIVVYADNEFTGYLLAGLAAVVMSLYGANHFRTLLGLKEQVDELHRLNNEFRVENTALAVESDKLTSAKEKLHDVVDNLRVSNGKLKDSLKKFRELDQHLKTISDDSIEGLARLQQSSQGVMDRWKENLVRHEKTMLNKVLDQVEYKDSKENMTKDEYNEFLTLLPPEWKAKFDEHKITFESIAGADGTIDYDEFNKMVDQITEEKALV